MYLEEQYVEIPNQLDQKRFHYIHFHQSHTLNRKWDLAQKSCQPPECRGSSPNKAEHQCSCTLESALSRMSKRDIYMANQL
jgi:hypothetical protein